MQFQNRPAVIPVFFLIRHTSCLLWISVLFILLWKSYLSPRGWRANLLMLSYSKTKFLLTGDRQQVTKIHIPHVLQPTLLIILASSLMNISLFLTKSLHCPNLVILTFVNFVVFARILTSKQPVPLPPVLFTLNVIIATPSALIISSLR